MICSRPRLVLALAALGLASGPALAAAPTPILEFYNTQLNHYFITASAAEAAFIDQGGAGPGWQRTGKTFAAYANAADAPAGAVPVCRFYGTPGKGPNSHFYTADAAECAAVKKDPGWTYESIAFYIATPASGACASGNAPVLRAYNQRWAQMDSNHRYTTDTATYNLMIAAGWSGEGAVFCAASADTPPPPPPPANNGECHPAYTPGDTRHFRVTATGIGAPAPAVAVERVGATVSFDGQSAIPSIWTDEAGQQTQIAYQQFTATDRLELGADSYNTATSQLSSSLKYSPYIHYPLAMSVGQSVSESFATLDARSGATVATNTLSHTFNGHEAVTVPAGTFSAACKYTSQTQTTASGITVIMQATTWLDPHVGLVKSYATTTNFGVTTTVTRELTSASVGGVVVP